MISALDRQKAAMAAAHIFMQQVLKPAQQHIACYLAFNDEFETHPMIEAIWQAKRTCYLPVLAAPNEKQLLFIRYQYGDPLQKNQYDILEPAHRKPTIAPSALDLVITPLIAFDHAGHRLGTGGGYYDATFSFLQQQATSPVLIGLAYAIQQADHLPNDPWDIQLSGVLTETGFLPST